MKMPEGLPHKVKIGNKFVGEGEPAYFISEIGNNHNGDFYLAKRSIEESVKAGADAVKLQKRFLEEVFTKELLDTPQTKNQVLGKTYGEYRKSMELDEEEFKELKKYSDELGVTFFATPFDKKSADFLERVGVDVYKIASFDVTNLPLLEYVAKLGKPIILSLGISSLEEMDEAIATILGHNNNLILLHCVGIYPAVDETLNLSTIPFLKERYAPLPVGYSGHEKDIVPTLSTIPLGTKCIERHFTLDKKLPGPDHATVSIEPDEFKEMVDSTRRIETMLGQPNKIVLEGEQGTRNKHTKSLVSARDIKKGETITAEMLTCKSPGTGIKPGRINEVLGKVVRVDIPADKTIMEDFVEM